MMARSSKAPSIGRIQKRKTNFSKSSLFGLQRATGPYRWATSEFMHRSKEDRLFDHFVGGREKRLRDGKAECPRGLKVDDQLELRR